jgi:WbqC-like protein family
MTLSIMQPYFLPYVGYFQLIAASDVFVVYDNIKYTKKGWINRNRMLREGEAATFSLPLKKASDSLDVRERELSADYDPEKLLNQFAAAYRRAPHFARTWPVIEEILRHEDRNLFGFLHHSIIRVCGHLGITTEIRVSSDIGIDHGLRNQDKVLALCEATGARRYVNPPGGMQLYEKDAFEARGLDLKFLKPKELVYHQFREPFVPWLSILDVMMFHAPESLRDIIETGYDLI